VVRLIVVALLVGVLVVPVVAKAIPVPCELALETGKFLDWVLCAVYVEMFGLGEGDWFGNTFYWGG
jgi:hypothetical protein